jgi:hypothetical protein
MPRTLRSLTPFVVLALGAWSLPACGGNSFEGGDGSSGAGGSAGTSNSKGGTASGGTSSGGTAGGGGGSCVQNGQTYADGDQIPADDGCNSCFCEDGTISCTLVDCNDYCEYDGTYYDVGDSFPASDGCNTCSCASGGAVNCTDVACYTCEDVESVYSQAIDQAKVCDPQLAHQCSEVVSEGLACGCQGFVNPANESAIAAVIEAQRIYGENACGGDVLCGACAPVLSGYCSAEGRCETVWGYNAGASCKVNDVTHPSGGESFAGPLMCHTCTCTDGELGCTDEACDSACPPNSVLGSQCVQCSAEGTCEVVEHACLPVCSDSCEGGAACVDGVCKALCN